MSLHTSLVLVAVIGGALVVADTGAAADAPVAVPRNATAASAAPSRVPPMLVYTPGSTAPQVGPSAASWIGEQDATAAAAAAAAFDPVATIDGLKGHPLPPMLYHRVDVSRFRDDTVVLMQLANRLGIQEPSGSTPMVWDSSLRMHTTVDSETRLMMYCPA